jgi:hypothetical protein
MQIQLVTPTGSVQVLRQLNPASDPPSPDEEERIRLPYTSGGFDTAPLWQEISINLNAHRGQSRAIRFAFETGDGRYNNFRGWIVDQVEVRVEKPTLNLVAGAFAPSLSEGGTGEELVPVDEMTFPDRAVEP